MVPTPELSRELGSRGYGLYVDDENAGVIFFWSRLTR
jgi:hypothetical protein